MISTILCSLISTGAISLCVYIGNENRKYKKLQLEQEENQLVKTVEEKLIKPLHEELAELKETLMDIISEEDDIKDQMMSMWRYRLLQLCRKYIAQGYILYGEYDQLSEIYKQYTHVGGNGQGKGFFDKASALPMYHTDEEALEDVERKRKGTL